MDVKVTNQVRLWWVETILLFIAISIWNQFYALTKINFELEKQTKVLKEIAELYQN